MHGAEIVISMQINFQRLFDFSIRWNQINAHVLANTMPSMISLYTDKQKDTHAFAKWSLAFTKGTNECIDLCLGIAKYALIWALAENLCKKRIASMNDWTE